MTNTSIISYAGACYKEAIRKTTSTFPSLSLFKLQGEMAIFWLEISLKQTLR